MTWLSWPRAQGGGGRSCAGVRQGARPGRQTAGSRRLSRCGKQAGLGGYGPCPEGTDRSRETLPCARRTFIGAVCVCLCCGAGPMPTRWSSGSAQSLMMQAMQDAAAAPVAGLSHRAAAKFKRVFAEVLRGSARTTVMPEAGRGGD